MPRPVGGGGRRSGRPVRAASAQPGHAFSVPLGHRRASGKDCGQAPHCFVDASSDVRRARPCPRSPGRSGRARRRRRDAATEGISSVFIPFARACRICPESPNPGVNLPDQYALDHGESTSTYSVGRYLAKHRNGVHRRPPAVHPTSHRPPAPPCRDRRHPAPATATVAVRAAAALGAEGRACAVPDSPEENGEWPAYVLGRIPAAAAARCRPLLRARHPAEPAS